jgi:hypothetical protein
MLVNDVNNIFCGERFKIRKCDETTQKAYYIHTYNQLNSNSYLKLYGTIGFHPSFPNSLGKIYKNYLCYVNLTYQF